MCNAFGFEKQLVVPDDDGNIVHAQLTYGNGMIMVGPIRDTEFGKYMKQPDEVDGAETQSVCLIVNDVDKAYERAKAEGADILIYIKDEEYRGRSFSCRDPEGHIWTLGTYDPWEA